MLLPGLSGSAPGELATKRKVSKGRVGNTANNPSPWWPLHGSEWHSVPELGGAGTGAEHCFLVWCAHEQKQLSVPCAPSSKHWDVRQKQKERRLTLPGQGDHRSKGCSDWSIQGEPFQGTLVAVLLGDFFLFTILKDYSPFHQCFFEMTGSAIH